MPTHETEAVVLRHYALSEADLIVVFFTREFGGVRAVARGARKMKSRLGGCLEPLNHVRLQYYAREGAELAKVWQCETIHSYLGKNPSLEAVYAFSYFAELVQELVQENNPSPRHFRLLLACLAAGEKIGVSGPLLRYFELWSLKLNGLLPDYGYCSNCRKCVKDEGFYTWVETGRICCPACAHDRGMRVGPDAANLLHRMLDLPPEQFAVQPMSGAAGGELERLAQRLLEYHLEKRLKSYAAYKEIVRGV